MRRFVGCRVAAILLVSLSFTSAEFGLPEKHANQEIQEDEAYWGRFIEEVTSSMVEPTPSPTPSPTVLSVPSKNPSETLPSASPSWMPSVSPTATPSETLPTVAPSVSLSSVPSASPVSTEPSAAQSYVPSAVPSYSPTKSLEPTMSPTGLGVFPTVVPIVSECSTKASIGCVSNSGVPCIEISPPSGQCSVGTTIEVIMFRLIPESCSLSRNSQDDSFDCQGEDSLPASGSAVIISCENESGDVFFRVDSQVGESIALFNEEGSGLPAITTCIVTDDETGLDLQTVTINTSGDIDLFLKDRYGMLEVEACEVQGQQAQSCLVPIVYTYGIENDGNSISDTTVFERSHNGIELNLIDRVMAANPLQPGDAISTPEMDELDVCMDGFYSILLLVEADATEGSASCEDVATYEFEVANTCRIDVDIECKTEDGTDCSLLQGADSDCSLSVTWTFHAANIGANALSVVEIEVEKDDIVLNLTGLIDITDLGPGMTTSVSYTETIDICAPRDFMTLVRVTADPPGNAASCEAEDMYTFGLDDTCNVFLDMDCSVLGKGTSCEDLEGEQEIECICDECVTEVMFQYTGVDAAEATGLHITNGEGMTLFIGTLSSGEEVAISNSECLTDTLTAQLTDVVTGEELMSYEIDTSCAGPELTLLDSFGPLMFTGYKCMEDSAPHTCFTDVEYSYTVSNSGVYQVEVKTLESTVHGLSIDLTTGINQEELILLAGETFEAVFGTQVNLCDSSHYTATAAVLTTYPSSANSSECGDEDALAFGITAGTPHPTPEASAAPSYSPSVQPSSGPTPIATLFPSVSPSRIPSIPSTEVPSLEPTILPATTDPSSLPSGVPTQSDDSSSPTTLTASPSVVPTTVLSTPTGSPAPTQTTLPASPTASPAPTQTPVPTDSPAPTPSAVPGTPTASPAPTQTPVPTDSPAPTLSTVPGTPTASPAPTQTPVPTDSPAPTPSTVPATPTASPAPTQTPVPTDSPAPTLSTVPGTPTASPAPTQTPVPTDSPAPTPSTVPATPTASPGPTQTPVPTESPAPTLSTVPATPTASPGPTQTPVPTDSPAPTLPSVPGTPTASPAPTLTAAPTSTPLPATPTASPAPTPPTAPGTPTDAPTPTPSNVPVATPNPTGTLPPVVPQECDVDASISCSLETGETCNLRSPVGRTCSGEPAEFLQFIYVPGSSCNGNNTATNFVCVDQNTNVTRPQSAYIYIGQNGTAWFNGTRTEGQVFDVPIVNGTFIEVEISLEESGTMLQQSTMSIECNEESALTLLTTFGHLQLVGFRNEEQGLQQVFADIDISYTATNVGLLDMELFGAFGSSPFAGFQSFLGDPVGVAVGGNETFHERFTMNVAAVAGTDIQFTFLAQGNTSADTICDGTAAFTLSVQD